MEEVNGRKVKILLVPCEECFPTSDVNIRSVNTFAFVAD
jgi:hypothetical protein